MSRLKCVCVCVHGQECSVEVLGQPQQQQQHRLGNDLGHEGVGQQCELPIGAQWR